MKIPQLKMPQFGIKEIVTGPPARYWGVFLLTVLILFIVVIAFDTFIFFWFSAPRINSEAITNQNLANPLTKNSLESVLNRMRERENNFKHIQGSSTLEALP